MKVGIIGAGHFGAVHARAIATVEGIEAVTCCGGTFSGAQTFAPEFGLVAHRTLEDLLQDPDIDTVVISTPHHLHEDIAVAAARSGKHILLEKPLAPTLAACDAVIDAARQHGIKLMVGHVVRFFEPFILMRSIIDSGDLGRPILGYSQLIKLWMEENRKEWHLKKETGGGMLLTGGIHAVDLLVWLMDQRVEAVSAQIGTLFNDQDADDSAFLGLRFTNGTLGHVQSVGFRDGAMSYGTEIVCERGVVRADLKNGVEIGQGGKWTKVGGVSETDQMHEAVVREWQAMRDAVNGTQPIPVTGEYARHIVAIIEAAMRSDRERRELTI